MLFMLVRFSEEDNKKMIWEYFMLKRGFHLIILISLFIISIIVLIYGIVIRSYQIRRIGIIAFEILFLWLLAFLIAYRKCKNNHISFFKNNSINNNIEYTLTKENDLVKIENMYSKNITVIKKDEISKIKCTKNFIFIYTFLGSIVLPKKSEILDMFK